MNELSALRSTLQTKSRSLGVKLFVVCGLALLMLLPALLVYGLLEDRTQREAEVVKEISAHVGGQQTFLGPTLALPFTVPRSPTDPPRRGMYLVFPAQASTRVKVATEERRRSLFKVPVFQTESKFDATLDLNGVPSALPPGGELDWSHAEMLIGVSDARGAQADATLAIGSKTFTLAPAEIAQNMALGPENGSSRRLTLFGTRIEGIAQPNAQFNVTST